MTREVTVEYVTVEHPIQKDDAVALARHAVVSHAKTELPDDIGLTARLLVVADPGEREIQARRGANWAHGMELWHMARAARMTGKASIDEWQVAMAWSATSGKLGFVAMFASFEVEKEKERAMSRMSSSALLLFGAAAGVALCVLLRLEGF